MLDEFVSNHIAVSSLESPEHATRKDPKIVTVTWFIGKRCNYDCSYCASYIHDNYSPHIDKNKAFNFIDQLEKYTIEQDKKFKISLTGGEPFVHPDFFEILSYIKKKETLTQLAVVTNGSLPLKMYIESSRYLTNITISLHLEQSEKIINDTIEKIIELNKINSWFLNVNLMELPGKLDKIKNIIEQFKTNNVKFVLRKIDPPFENQEEFVKKSDDEHIKISKEKNFIEGKLIKKVLVTENLDARHQSYYSKEELDFLSTYENIEQWQNIKLYSKNEIIETNTDIIKSNDLNSWKGWLCYIGIDSIYVQHEGTVFRGNCMQGESLGQLGKNINWPKKPLICPVSRCTCNADMVVRKIKNKKYEKFIDD